MEIDAEFTFRRISYYRNMLMRLTFRERLLLISKLGSRDRSMKARRDAKLSSDNVEMISPL
jgi:hypothetical protein